MARGPEAKEMTETCYVSSSAWRFRAGGGLCMYKWDIGEQMRDKKIKKEDEKKHKEFAGVWFCLFACRF